MKAIEILREINACEEACIWAGDKTPQEAWDTCPRGDWMLTYYSRKYPENKRQLTLAKGHCANTVRHLMTDPRNLAAVDAAIAYGNGECSDEDLRSATYAAATSNVDYTDADAAAYAAVYIDAHAAYAADGYDHNDTDKSKNQLETANICRKYLHL